MATINLGAIKFNWKGAYNSSTTYAVDDVVSSGGNSYVCIQAHSNQAVGNATAYWNIMSSAGTNGTNGTDISTTLTTQGDILIRNGSGLARLGYGTSGQLLTTGGSGANPSWTTVDSGGVIQTKFYETGVAFTQANTNFTNLGSFAVTITPTSASNKILVMLNLGVMASQANTSSFRFTRNDTAVGIGDVNGNRSRTSFTIQGTTYTASNHPHGLFHGFIDTPNSTSALTYRVQAGSEGGGSIYINRGRDDGNDGSIYYPQAHSTLIAQEIKA